MKRIQLFEFEDFSWFPNWIRDSMTRLILVMHRMLKTNKDLEEVVSETLKRTGKTRVFDFCSGSGGLMPEVIMSINKMHKTSYALQLSDLFPNKKAALAINNLPGDMYYKTDAVDVTRFNQKTNSLRTMVCSFHHMNPTNAKAILKSAADANEPIVIYEMSDNSFPAPVAWFALLTNFIMCLFITPFVKGLTFAQLIFTYFIPIIPIFYAWDGAISNLRTYTPDDLKILLEDIKTPNYSWETRIIKKNTKRLCLIGIPKNDQ